MPVYEYRCTACAHRFSQFARRVAQDGEPLPRCPQCGAETERLLSSFAYHRSLKMQLEQLDPRIEKELDAVDNVKGDDPLDRLNMAFPPGAAE
ncbi:MAG TPA: zinc ribbon domain-containing protein [Dehalococcoidia bacterium]|nr:zinc ribbon domain-containing protein [Dehalococcoidia bacterium]